MRRIDVETWMLELDLCDGHVVETIPSEWAGKALDAWRQDHSKPKPSEIYRTWAKRLREEKSPEAKLVLRDLLLETTVPMNELETPAWLDSYTGEMIDISGDIPVIETSDWNHYLSTRMPEVYKDPEQAQIAMKASMEWVGMEEEEVVEEDRGYEPPTFSEKVGPDGDIFDLRQELREEMDLLRRRIRLSVERNTRAEDVRNAVQNSIECREFLDGLQEMLRRGENPANVLGIIQPFMHGYGLEDEQLDALKMVGNERSLLEWREMFEEDMEPFEGGPLQHRTVSDAEIDSIASRYLQDILDSIPVDGDAWPGVKPVLRSRAFAEGFIRAQIAGSEDPASEGWANWRKKTSLKGHLAYQDAIRKGMTQTQAMAAFFRAAQSAGDVQGQPKRIEAVMPSGLRLVGGRMITWSTAALIAKAEGFQDKERLKELLQSKGWGVGLVPLL